MVGRKKGERCSTHKGASDRKHSGRRCAENQFIGGGTQGRNSTDNDSEWSNINDRQGGLQQQAFLVPLQLPHPCAEFHLLLHVSHLLQGGMELNGTALSGSVSDDEGTMRKPRLSSASRQPFYQKHKRTAAQLPHNYHTINTQLPHN